MYIDLNQPSVGLIDLHIVYNYLTLYLINVLSNCLTSYVSYYIINVFYNCENGFSGAPVIHCIVAIT